LLLRLGCYYPATAGVTLRGRGPWGNHLGFPASNCGELVFVVGVGGAAGVTEAEEDLLGAEEDIHHRKHPVSNPELLVLRTRNRFQDLPRPLPKPGRNAVNALQVEVFELEKEVVDRVHHSVQLLLPDPSGYRLSGQPFDIPIRVFEHCQPAHAGQLPLRRQGYFS
jgi:hypothetical protein